MSWTWLRYEGTGSIGPLHLDTQAEARHGPLFIVTARKAVRAGEQRHMMRKCICLIISVLADGVACSAGPQDAASEPPPESKLDPPVSTGCRFEERVLGKDEVFEPWPAPSQLAATVSHEYVGPVSWRDPDARPADEIEIEIATDAEHVTLRYPISPPRPNEPIICTSSLVVPITARLRLGQVETELSGLYVTHEKVLGLSAKLPESFAATFAIEHTDGYKAYLWISFDGSAVAGRFELMKGGVVPRTPASFLAR